MIRLNLIGVRFGRLIPQERLPNKGRDVRWLCNCDCGNTHVATTTHLRCGAVKSCGCYLREWASKKQKTHGASIKGSYLYEEYEAWTGMISRCYRKTNHFYFNYGGRGIKVCDRWRYSFENFIQDMGKKPSKEHSLDRIESNGNYEPNNCRWGTKKQQAGNRNSNRWIEYNGRKMILQDWANEFNVDVRKLSYYLNKHPLQIAVIMSSNNVVSNKRYS